MSIIRRLERRSAVPEWGSSTPPTNGSLGGSAAGVNVSERTALQITAVYGSVGVIADAIATLPWWLLSSLDPARRRQLPLSDLLRQPFTEISRMDWITEYATSMALRGNFYGQVVDRDENFYPTQIKPWHPDMVSVKRAASGSVEYRYGRNVVQPDDVFHVRNLSLAGSLAGLNPIQYLRVSLGLAVAVEDYGSAYFTNDASASVVISVPDELDADETLAMAQAWKGSHQGGAHWHMPAVVTGGATVSQVSITPQDSQFLESRQYSGSDISGKIFRVPPHMIGIVDKSTSWGTGIEQQELGFVRNTLLRYIKALEEALTFLQPDERQVRFNLKERLRGDTLARAQANSLARAGGWTNGDEIRAEEDMPPMPDGLGQIYLAPINTESLSQMTNESIAAAAAKAQQDAIAQGHADDALRASPQELHVAVDPTINITLPELRTDVHAGAAPNVTVQAPQVMFQAPEVRVPDVNVTVDVPVPSVTVRPAEVRVNVPEQPAPNVTVRNVLPKPERRSTVKTVERDKDGRVSKVVEEES